MFNILQFMFNVCVVRIILFGEIEIRIWFDPKAAFICTSADNLHIWLDFAPL